ncbi:AbrB/MazE/SpoVT family DNA-binding domain-containing protein [Achromobacter sp. GbtcB20]|uniref:AbrB/MazE/SpoVT family DNA-binding domain-containing protein n=1 Tax=Achromobacter sp. GbtcB20 TaxID=2824765 RepID=UPI00353006D9
MSTDSRLVTVTARGRITIPRHIRRQAGWKPGDKIVFTLSEGGTLSARRSTDGFNRAKDHSRR